MGPKNWDVVLLGSNQKLKNVVHINSDSIKSNLSGQTLLFTTKVATKYSSFHFENF